VWTRNGIQRVVPLAVLVGVAAVLVQSATGQDGRTGKTRTDAEGVPLPESAIARLGSSRFRFDGYPYCPPVFSVDGRQVAVGGNRSVSVFDVASGRVLRVVPLPDRYHPRMVRFLADGNRLAVGSGDWQSSAELTVYDLGDGKVVATSKFSGKSQIFVVDVTPDGSRVLVEDRFVKAYLWDVKSQREVWAFEHPEASDTLPFTSDGKHLVLARNRQAELRHAATGNVVSTFPNPGPGFGSGYSAAMSPDGRLAIRGDRESVVAILSAAGKDRMRTLPADRTVERLFFSTDSRYLVAPDQYGTQLWDLTAADDKGPVVRLPAANSAGFSPDGKTLALAGAGFLTVWSVGDWKRLPQSADPVSPVHRVWFTADGKQVLGYTRSGWVRWPAGGGPGTRLSDDSGVHPEGLADVSADGRVAIDVLHQPGKNPRSGRGGDTNSLRVTDLTTGKDRRFPVEGSPYMPFQISADGRHALAYLGSEIVVWALGTGEVLHRNKNRAGSPVFGATATVDGKGLSRSAAGNFADRGARLVLEGPMYASVTVTDHTTGREWKMNPVPWSVYSGGATFSRDGSKVVVHGRWDGDWNKDTVTVWDARTGRRLMNWERGLGYIRSTTLATDNRSLLIGDHNGRLALVEAATGGERVRLQHAGYVMASAFHPDGLKAVSSSPDAPVYVWDLLGDPGKWDASKADAVWTDLISPDAKVAFAAIRKLRANPVEALTFLRDRIKLPAPPSDDAVAALLKRLDGPRFADREQAQKELSDVAEPVRPRLEAARKTASEEAGRRLDQVLQHTEGLTPERLRHVRACEVLEGIGTPKAIQQLRSWAEGPEGARLTSEAKESLVRDRMKPERRE
jgi:WD40 repeat protein